MTVSRQELIVDGSDHDFRRLVHGLFAFLARHEAVRSGHGSVIGLAGIEYTVLISIGHMNVEERSVSVNRLAEHLHLSGAFVPTLTNRLAKLGLVHKEQDTEDRRRVNLRISTRGRELLAELAPTQRQVNDVQFEPLGREEFLWLIDMVEKLIKSSDRAMQLQTYLSSGNTRRRPEQMVAETLQPAAGASPRPAARRRDAPRPPAARTARGAGGVAGAKREKPGE